MESVDLDMDDLFDVRGDINEDAAFPPSPTGGFSDNEAQETGGGDGDDGEGEANEDGEIQSQVIKKLRDMSKGAAKKVIKNPQPKLDADRLNGDRGIPVLPKIFKDFKMKGPGHEIEDLQAMMRKMEHWAHRLFPKMTFDEVIERVERLGAKKAVQTTVKKIRLDMPLLDEEFVNQEEEDKPSDAVDEDDGRDHGFPEEVDMIDSDAEDVLNDIMREDSGFSQSVSTPAQKDTTPLSQLNTPQDMPSTPTPSQMPQTNGTTPSPLLSDEIKERIERNKRLALERREARLKGRTPAKIGACTPSTPATPGSQTSQMVATQNSQASQENVTEVSKANESSQSVNEPSSVDNKLVSDDDIHLFVDGTMETEQESQSCEVKDNRGGKDMHLFVEPTMSTDEGQVEKGTSGMTEPADKDLRLFVEPTLEPTGTQGTVQETNSNLEQGAMNEEFHLCIEETAAMEEERNKESEDGATAETLEAVGGSGALKSVSDKTADIEMTEDELQLFLEETESGDASCGVGDAGTKDKSESVINVGDTTHESPDVSEMHLCIDSNEESQEEEGMDTNI